MVEHKHKPDEHNSPGWQFHPEESLEAPSVTSHYVPEKPEGQQVSWTASEFVANPKTGGWYVLLALAASVLCIAVYIVTHDLISAGVIILVASILAIFGARQPRTLDYKIDSGGMYIGGKFYPYMDFRSFSVLDEGAVSSIVLMPLKRFMPPITVYYAPTDEEHIIGILSDFLPFEQREHDMVDRFMRKIRF